jgi:hypothetical protein
VRRILSDPVMASERFDGRLGGIHGPTLAPLFDRCGSASCPVVPGWSPLITSLLSGRGFVAYLCLHEKFQFNLRILAIAYEPKRVFESIWSGGTPRTAATSPVR